jgi:hypothetical protein
MALATRGIGAVMDSNYRIKQERLRNTPVPTRVINVNDTPITNRRDQIMLGKKYSPNASAVGRFDRAAARIAGRAEQAAGQAQPNYIMGRQMVQPLQPNYGQSIRTFGGSGGTRIGFSSSGYGDGYRQTYWSAPSLR